MTYFVTAVGFDASGRPAPAFIDVAGPGKKFDLNAALERACQMISEGKTNVTIRDDDGHSICGVDLGACCLGEKFFPPTFERNNGDRTPSGWNLLGICSRNVAGPIALSFTGLAHLVAWSADGSRKTA
jgi:hypothetical protein